MADAPDPAGRLERVLRYGLIVLLVLWGSMKFMNFEAEAIRELVANHP